MLRRPHFERKFDKQAIKNQSTFLFNAPWLPGDHCFLEDSKASPVYPSGKSNVYMKVSTKHWWNDCDRGKPEKNLSQCHIVQHKPFMDWPESKPGLRDDKWATARPYQVKLIWYWYIKVWIVPRILLQLSYGVSTANGVRTITDLGLYSQNQAVTHTPSVRYVGFLKAKPGGLHDNRHQLKL
jgi:hypothetical protein